jgi:hypothetical protein
MPDVPRLTASLSAMVVLVLVIGGELTDGELSECIHLRSFGSRERDLLPTQGASIEHWRFRCQIDFS